MAQANPTAVTTPSLDDVWHDKKQLRTEILGGITAFFAISYIIVVNPMILADAKMPASLTMFSTIFVSVIGCMLMGIFADAPMILTPGMGVNAFFTYTLVVDMRLTWQQAIAVSIIGSVFYCIIAFSKLSQIISDGIPDSLKTGITVGIGVFLVQIGLQKAGLIKSGGSRSLLAFGSLADPSVILAIFGLVLSLWLFMRKVPGGFVISIAATTIVGLLFQIKGQTVPNASLGNLAHYGDIFMKGDFSQILTPKFLLAIFAMAMIQLFEAMGILEGMLPDKSKFKKSFEVSAFTTFLSGIFGTSPTVDAAESASGIQSGARTGVMSITVGIMFALSTFFVPLLSFVPQAAVAPVIIITGALMMEDLKGLDFAHLENWFPVFLIVVMIPFTGSVSTGMAFGFVSYPLCQLLTGHYKRINAVNTTLALAFLLTLVANTFLS
ncbi:NCS2 family permease [Schleiferilactobacillus harbinensis]|nr:MULTISPECIES: NCS2 family permease [Schleiferilactobacillus]MBO3092987.1 NCS2 family permease [Schleiferilactobacillus harbinensis]